MTFEINRTQIIGYGNKVIHVPMKANIPTKIATQKSLTAYCIKDERQLVNYAME